MKLIHAVDRMACLHPEHTAPGRGWPCTVLLARALVIAAGQQHVGPWRSGGPWWQAVNIWDEKVPFSLLDAVEDVARTVATDPPPSALLLGVNTEDATCWLIPDRWCAVQGARRLLEDGTADSDDIGWGHAFFLRMHDNHETCDVIESSVRRGLRLNGQPWRGGPTPDPIPLADVVSEYPAGLGIAPLWDGT